MDPNPDNQRPATDDRAKTFARRALIQAGWAVPAVVLFALPNDAEAASGHGDGSHTDTVATPFTDVPSHSDGPFMHFDDSHNDFRPEPHSDLTGPHVDSVPGHFDVPLHSDGSTGFIDHFDQVHGDFVGPHVDNVPGHADVPFHSDTANGFAPHIDS